MKRTPLLILVYLTRELSLVAEFATHTSDSSTHSASAAVSTHARGHHITLPSRAHRLFSDKTGKINRRLQDTDACGHMNVSRGGRTAICSHHFATSSVAQRTCGASKRTLDFASIQQRLRALSASFCASCGPYSFYRLLVSLVRKQPCACFNISQKNMATTRDLNACGMRAKRQRPGQVYAGGSKDGESAP